MEISFEGFCEISCKLFCSIKKRAAQKIRIKKLFRNSLMMNDKKPLLQIVNFCASIFSKTSKQMHAPRGSCSSGLDIDVMVSLSLYYRRTWKLKDGQQQP